MTPLCLEREHHRGQFLRFDFLPVAQLADVVVLAELAVEVAPGEEDGAGATPPSQWVLFPQVGVVTGDDGPHAGLTRTGTLVAVHAALPAAEVAGVQALVGGLHAPLQLA